MGSAAREIVPTAQHAHYSQKLCSTNVCHLLERHTILSSYAQRVLAHEYVWQLFTTFTVSWRTYAGRAGDHRERRSESNALPSSHLQLEVRHTAESGAGRTHGNSEDYVVNVVNAKPFMARPPVTIFLQFTRLDITKELTQSRKPLECLLRFFVTREQ
jgi:hypothetical protein